MHVFYSRAAWQQTNAANLEDVPTQLFGERVEAKREAKPKVASQYADREQLLLRVFGGEVEADTTNL